MYGVPNSCELEPANGATEGHWFFEGSRCNDPEPGPIRPVSAPQMGHFDDSLLPKVVGTKLRFD